MMGQWVSGVPGPHPEQIATLSYAKGPLVENSRFSVGVKLITETADGLKTKPTQMVSFVINDGEFNMPVADARIIALRVLEFCDFIEANREDAKGHQHEAHRRVR